MAINRDMNVDAKVITEMIFELENISKSLLQVNDSLNKTIIGAGEELEGMRFQSIKENTIQCINENNRIKNSIDSTMKYLSEIEHLLDEYSKCSFETRK